MKILIINPNSDLEMTASIQKTAENFSNSEYEVICESSPGSPPFIETHEDQIKTAPGMIQLVRKNENLCDAFIVACHCDPNLDVIKEITTKPVVGIGEASMKIASMLGHRFSVLSSDKHAIPNKETLIQKYNLQNSLASVRAPEKKMENSTVEEKFLQVAQKAIEEDMAEVIVLGCAGMTGLAETIQHELGIPVLDGVVCGLIIASGLVKSNISTSKIGKYNPNY